MPGSRLPTPATELWKLNATAITNKIVQQTLVRVTQIPQPVVKKPTAAPKLIRNGEVLPKPKLREEILAPGFHTDNTIKFGIMYALNPALDRQAAILGHADKSKLFIKLYHPPYGQAGGFEELKYPLEVDFSRQSCILSLNRWRKAVFQHYLGQGLQETSDSDWHQLEKDFIMEACSAQEEKARSKPVRTNRTIDGHNRLYSWMLISQDFNSCFAGRVLPGCSKPRPARRRTDLVIQHRRMRKEAKLFSRNTWENQEQFKERHTPPSATPIQRPASKSPKSQGPRYRRSMSSIPMPVQQKSDSK